MLKIIYHESYLTPYFTSVVESPTRIKAIHNRLKERYETVAPDPATVEDILRVHTREHLRRVQVQGRDTYQTALMAAGGALCGARLAALEGARSFAAVRPPGHHAGRARHGGFCFFNNVAVGVASLLHGGYIRKAVVVDTDMHHGDGTEDIFSDVESVAVINIRAKEREAYLDLLREELARIPRVDLIAVSAGFDLYVRDWGGLLETSDFRRIGFAIHQAAVERASGKCFAVLEGGYFLDHLGRNVLAFCRGLEGERE